MIPLRPSWFAQRQGKVEGLTEDSAKLSAPNVPERFIGVRSASIQHWTGWLKESPDAEPIAATSVEYDNVTDAWNAAFELYRVHVIC